MKRLLLITLSLLMVQGTFANDGKRRAARGFTKVYLVLLGLSALVCVETTRDAYHTPEPGLAKNLSIAAAVVSGGACLGLLALPVALIWNSPACREWRNGKPTYDYSSPAKE